MDVDSNSQKNVRTGNIFPPFFFVLITVGSVSHNLSDPRNYNIERLKNLQPVNWLQCINERLIFLHSYKWFSEDWKGSSEKQCEIFWQSISWGFLWVNIDLPNNGGSLFSIMKKFQHWSKDQTYQFSWLRIWNKEKNKSITANIQ